MATFRFKDERIFKPIKCKKAAAAQLSGVTTTLADYNGPVRVQFDRGESVGTMRFVVAESDTVSATFSGMTALASARGITASNVTYAFDLDRMNGARKKFIGVLISGSTASSEVMCQVRCRSNSPIPPDTTGFTSITTIS
jgi:hypothetical protein